MSVVSGRSGRRTFFTAVFNTFTPAIKEAWTNNLQMAKLALGKTRLKDASGTERHTCEGAGSIVTWEKVSGWGH